MEVRPIDAEPAVVLWSWAQVYLKRDSLPNRRVVVRFEFEYRDRRDTSWLLIQDGDAELCATDPGFGDDLVVEINDAITFARWHLGQVEWTHALRSGDVLVKGTPSLRKALPTWNRRPELGRKIRASIEDPRATAELVYSVDDPHTTRSA